MTALVAVALACCASSVPALADTCPQSIVAIYNTEPVPHTEAAFETTSATNRVTAYDMRAGTLRINHPGGVGSLFVEGADRYRVIGPPDGTPLAITARLDVDGYAETAGCGGTGCWGEFRAQIGQGAVIVEGSAVARFAAERKELVTSLDFPLQVTVGEDFELQCRLTFIRAAGASHWGGGRSQLHFVGLPPAAAVVSCQGYDSATPVRATSWGRLKTLYR